MVTDVAPRPWWEQLLLFAGVIVGGFGVLKLTEIYAERRKKLKKAIKSEMKTGKTKKKNKSQKWICVIANWCEPL